MFWHYKAFLYLNLPGKRNGRILFLPQATKMIKQKIHLFLRDGLNGAKVRKFLKCNMLFMD